MSWTFCTSGAAIAKAGALANATIVADVTNLALWSDQAEGRICMKCKTDFITNWNSLDTPIQNALAEAEACLVAINIINYDLEGYSGIEESSTMVDVLKDTYEDIIINLRDDKYQKINK